MPKRQNQGKRMQGEFFYRKMACAPIFFTRVMNRCFSMCASFVMALMGSYLLWSLARGVDLSCCLYGCFFNCPHLSGFWVWIDDPSSRRRGLWSGSNPVQNLNLVLKCGKMGGWWCTYIIYSMRFWSLVFCREGLFLAKRPPAGESGEVTLKTFGS